MNNRYDTSLNPEGQFQPGSEDQVLLNRLGITDPAEMDDVELILLEELQAGLLGEIEIDQSIKVSDLCNWHKQWLGTVYAWAGQYRTVNMQKNDFMFAAAKFLPKLMDQLEKDCLSIHTPCEGFGIAQLLDALAICHVELIIIHPFRDGNGRLARVLATIMALQAGLPLLDFTYLTEHENEYIAAIHAGHSGDYEPMSQVFSAVLRASQS